MMRVNELEALWAEPTGPLYRLRQGELDEEIAERILAVLRRTSIPAEAEALPRRLVEVTWYMPLFLSWQRGRVAERGGDEQAFARLLDEVTNEMERILGLP